jgi:hypothetical protein
MRVVARIVLAALVAFVLVSYRATAVADDTLPAPVVASPALAAIEAGADDIVSIEPLYHLDRTNPFEILAYQGADLTLAARVFANRDPARSTRYASIAMSIANYLAQHDALAPDHRLGWGKPTAWDAFADGRINPPHQVYAYETALVSWALLETYTMTRDPRYLTTVERVMAGYLPFSVTRLGLDCQNCRVFWYSTNRNDAGRYVKNTNVLMGWVMALLYQITRQSQYLMVAGEVYNEETYEITRGNFSYLGLNDPQYNPATGLEAHIALETLAYSQIAALLRLPASETRPLLDRMDATFWNCGSACLAAPVTLGPAAPGDASIYLQFMTCYPASFNPVYAAKCARALTTPGLQTPSLFPLAGLLYALPNLPTR